MAYSSIFSTDPGANNDLPMRAGVFSPEVYLSRQANHIAQIDCSLVEAFSSTLESVTNSGGQVFFTGNGGSFGIAEHMVCDYAKGMKRVRKNGFRAVCIGSNGCLHSALVNDFGRDNALAAELEMYATSKDAVVAISSSGNSQNILNAVEYANSNKMVTLGLDGFGGGRLTEITHMSFTTSAATYPEVEACHQVFLDAVAFSLWK